MPAIATAYSARATEYADALGSMDAVHPSDRQLVETWASTVTGAVLDAGCGPGHWTNFLHTRGVDVRGIDLTPEFVARARATYPGVAFDPGDLDALDEPDGSLGGILAWFSTIHHEPAHLRVPLTEFARILRPGGTLLLGYFDGPVVEPFDHAVVRAYRWPASELSATLDAAGFDIIETHRRTERGRRDVGAILGERRTG